jgi:hypothetical protein
MNDRLASLWEDDSPEGIAFELKMQRQKETMAYSDAIAQEICERIAAGEFLTVMCENHYTMPTVRRCNQWLREHDEFRALYDESIQDRLMIFEDEVVVIPDKAAKDFDEITNKNGDTRRILDPTRITAAKLRVDVRFRHLKAGKPQKWGDSQTIITKSEDLFGSLSTEDLERKIANLETKRDTVRAA